VERAEAEAIYEQGREVVVAVLLRMDEQIARLGKRVESQERRIAELERKSRRSSRNSSVPPSQDPPGTPPRRGQDPSGRKQGAQPGREGKGRPLLPAWAVDEVVDHWPAGCGCGHVFSEAELVAAADPARHQVEELPPVHVIVTEHRCQRVRCPGCGARPRGELPAGVAASAFGPAFSRRGRGALDTQPHQPPRRRGAVRAAVRRADLKRHGRRDPGPRGRRARGPYADLLDRVRAAEGLNVDETGWRTAGQRRALWGAFSDRHAILRVRADRHEDHAKDLLGSTTAIVTSDRWWAYGHLPVRRRQVCWAHLQRDFKSHAEGLGAEQAFGEAGLRICEQLFRAWEIFQHTGERTELKRHVRALRRELKPILRSYASKAPRYRYTRGMARNLLKIWPALWTFADHNGTEPTNNHAERALRSAVIYRKLSLGSQSDAGERRIERLLSAHTTCRLQRRSLHAYLIDALGAHARGDPAPLLA
jgi:transposase